MRNSQTAKNNTIKYGRRSTDRLELFTISYPTKTTKPRKLKPIMRKEKPGLKWQILFFVVAALLLAYTSYSHSAPPTSRGARPIALGNGYSAMSGDGYSLYYNPAGLFEIGQKETITDFGRSYSIGESARTDFNGIYAMPYRWGERYFPLAFGFYAEQTAPGAHIIDMTMGGAFEAPIGKWSRGLIKRPTKAGVALTIRHQNGDEISNIVGKSAIALGLSGGFHASLNRKHSLGLSFRNLFLGDGNPRGASLQAGVLRRHSKRVTVLADLEYGRGGVWRFKPGLEWMFYRGVLRPRLGWGYRDNGATDHVATGVGFYLSPIQMDISYQIPIKTLSDNSGQIRVSLRYRFGEPQFTEIYYDHALEAANELDLNVLNLTVREAELKSSLTELQQKLFMAREDLEKSQKRIEALMDRDLLAQRDAEIRKLKARVKSLESKLSKQKGIVKGMRKKKATVRTHVVKAGETLQSLAERYYGSANQWKKIYNANPDKVIRGLPQIGAKLVIP